MQKQTSCEAYTKYKRGGQAMKSDYDRIIKCLALNPNGFTRNEIALITAIPINRITGRVNELIDDGFIEVDGRRESHATGYTGEIIKLKNRANQKEQKKDQQ